MQKFLIRKPTLTAKESRLLDETLERFSNACTFIAAYADEHQVYTVERLRKHPYRNVVFNQRVRNKFGLNASIAEAAIRRVIEDFGDQNAKCRNRRREHIPTYEGNNWIFCTSNAKKGGTVSIIMPALHAAHRLDLAVPMRLSMATYKKKEGRLKVPFSTQVFDVREDDDWKKGRIQLVHNASDAGFDWILVCHIEVPDEDEPTPKDDTD